LTRSTSNSLPRGYVPADFLPAIWESGRHNGQSFAVPLDTHPFVMYYNVDVCRQAGLLDAGGRLRPLTGPDQIVDGLPCREAGDRLRTASPWRPSVPAR